MEFLSLVENYEKLGGPLPETLKNKINGNAEVKEEKKDE